MDDTLIKFPRARSLYNQTAEDVLTANSVVLPYGSPYTFASTLYYQESHNKRNHLFIVGDNTVSLLTPLLYHVGPYWSGEGVIVNNDQSSQNLGKISLNLTAGSNITITNGNNNDKVISAVSNNDVLICTAEYNSSTGKYTVTGLTAQEIVTAYTNNKIVICKNVFPGQYFYLSLAGDLDTIMFSSLRHTNSQECDLKYDGTNSNTWTLVNEDNYDEWSVVNIDNGTTVHNIYIRDKRQCIIIDNSSNEQTVALTFSASANSSLISVTNVYAANDTLKSVAAGMTVMVKTKVVSSNSVYYEITQITKNPH